MFSERVNPWMALVKSTADSVRETRDPLPKGHPAILAERALLARTGENLGALRKARDAWLTHVFGAMYGSFPIATTTQAGQPTAIPNKE